MYNLFVYNIIYMLVFDVIIIIVFLVIGYMATTGAKTQFVRLLDVFIYGPFLIILGFQFENLIIRYLLFFMGATTIAYNLKNYVEIQMKGNNC